MKVWAYLAIVALLVGVGYKAFAFTYEKGVADTEIAYKDALQEVRDKAAADALDDYKAAQAIAGNEIDTEIQIVTEIREIEREIEVIVERIVEVKPECAVLPELGSLFSRQAQAANGASIHLSEDPG